ncbi:hypothetical protein [Mycobacterium marseillense]|uniref:hypothetical protein n=1 Tax=Mycobacterium marseillense TaxID=701042 RepID=UPI0019D540B9|nr:hypothetical protein [Mycobacterium marseillense]
MNSAADDRTAAFVDENDIGRVLHDYCRGIARLDLALVRDCYWPRATDRRRLAMLEEHLPRRDRRDPICRGQL